MDPYLGTKTEIFMDPYLDRPILRNKDRHFHGPILREAHTEEQRQKFSWTYIEEQDINFHILWSEMRVL